jgi:hypothetical protein
VRRKGSISHVPMLTGFAGIVIWYVKSFVISLYKETLGAELSI